MKVQTKVEKAKKELSVRKLESVKASATVACIQA